MEKIKGMNVSDTVADKIFSEYLAQVLPRCDLWDDVEDEFWRRFRTAASITWLNTIGVDRAKTLAEQQTADKLIERALAETGEQETRALRWLASECAAMMGWTK